MTTLTDYCKTVETGVDLRMLTVLVLTVCYCVYENHCFLASILRQKLVQMIIVTISYVNMKLVSHN